MRSRRLTKGICGWARETAWCDRRIRVRAVEGERVAAGRSDRSDSRGARRESVDRVRHRRWRGADQWWHRQAVTRRRMDWATATSTPSFRIRTGRSGWRAMAACPGSTANAGVCSARTRHCLGDQCWDCGAIREADSRQARPPDSTDTALQDARVREQRRWGNTRTRSVHGNRITPNRSPPSACGARLESVT